MPSLNDYPPGVAFPFTFQLTTAAISSSAFGAGALSGAAICVFNQSGATPGTGTTRTATQMIADSNLPLGQYLCIIINGQTTGTLTVAAGSGVTATGTLTVAANTGRLFTVNVTNIVTPAITITGLAISFTATALAFGV